MKKIEQEIKFTNYKGDSTILTGKRKCKIGIEEKYYKITKYDDGIPASTVEINAAEFQKCPLLGFAELKLYVTVGKTEWLNLADNFNRCMEITYNDGNTKYLLNICNMVSLEERENKYKICYMPDYWSVDAKQY